MTMPLTPPQIAKELDRFIIGQERAKRAIAVALRNRWRRQQARPCASDTFPASRYLLTGPKGVGKSATVRRAAQVVNAPFTQVDALYLAGHDAPGKAVAALLESLVECVQPQAQTQEQTVDSVSASAIVMIDGIDRLFPAALSDDSHDERLETAQHAFQRLLFVPVFHTHFGAIPARNVLIFAASQVPASRLDDRWLDLHSLFPRRIDLDNLTDDDLLQILLNDVSSPVQRYVALMATEGLTLYFTPDGLKAIAIEAGEQNRKMEDIGAWRLPMVLEMVLDDVLFDPASTPQTDVMIDAGYVSARITVDGDDEDLTDFIL